MTKKYKILILGASYGSLLATKLALAGHDAKMVCLPAEAELVNREGTRVRMPIKCRDGLTEIDSRKLPGKITAATPADVNPTDFDLAVLAMQEPQYRSAGVRELLDKIAKTKTPAMSIMNMPPLPYLARIPGLNANDYRDCYADATVWDSFDPDFLTLCSPDPQAFRPPQEGTNVLQVRLPTNFKAARFVSDAHTAMLRDLERDIEAVRFDAGSGTVGNTGNGLIELPVKLKVYDSVFVPLAKWSMLLAGNYRCVHKDGMRPIKDAVHSDIKATGETYNWVADLCKSLGAAEQDLVPFEKYAAAANGLGSPSSAARALYGGSLFIERVDRLVQTIAAKKGKQSAVVDEVVALVEAQLKINRAAAPK